MTQSADEEGMEFCIGFRMGADAEHPAFAELCEDDGGAIGHGSLLRFVKHDLTPEPREDFIVR